MMVQPTAAQGTPIINNVTPVRPNLLAQSFSLGQDGRPSPTDLPSTPTPYVPHPTGPVLFNPRRVAKQSRYRMLVKAINADTNASALYQDEAIREQIELVGRIADTTEEELEFATSLNLAYAMMGLVAPQ